MIIALPQLPPWWNLTDAAVCESYRREEARVGPFPYDPDTATKKDDRRLEKFLDSLHPRMDEYSCRRCIHWVSPDGDRGLCLGRYCQSYMEYIEAEPKAEEDFLDAWEPSVRGYESRHFDMCEEWEPLLRNGSK